MANEAMDVMFNMLNRMPKGKDKRADEQYGDQCFIEFFSRFSGMMHVNRLLISNGYLPDCCHL
ncbi:MAG: hypothetical protein F4Y39_19105 [Gemmatimonadetes bacterium]|nr:hypothetical protein [Gemmatimonadota bacterium]MYB59237.1 hypothetical protein [Gemmatimonadota bacterium]MYC15838.1 hypothetical protein [Gemmatimonadota bacterium]MYD63114.1 hypothetical protein [Gemmatimonadota bacterium]